MHKKFKHHENSLGGSEWFLLSLLQYAKLLPANWKENKRDGCDLQG